MSLEVSQRRTVKLLSCPGRLLPRILAHALLHVVLAGEATVISCRPQKASKLGELDAVAGELSMPLLRPLGHPGRGLAVPCPSATSSRDARIATTPCEMGSAFKLFIAMYFCVVASDLWPDDFASAWTGMSLCMPAHVCKPGPSKTVATQPFTVLLAVRSTPQHLLHAPYGA